MKVSFKVMDLFCRYGDQDVLRHISLTLPANKIIGVIGPNGCGKSTLLAHLGRLQVIEKTIRLDNRYIESFTARQYAKKVAILTQIHDQMVEDFLVKDIILMGRYPHKNRFTNYSPKDYELVIAMMHETGLTSYSDTPLSQLSGGERQRVFIAKALVQEPDVLLLDEPTNHLDMKYKIALMKLLKKSNKTIVIVLHDLNLVVRYCDYVVMMNKGQVVKTGPVNDVMKPKLLEAVFEVPFQKEEKKGIFYLYY